ncbi:MAG: phage holin family protein [Anaerolineales bacterium]|nr:phage holin family protein [Anaerolineales bacterium]
MPSIQSFWRHLWHFVVVWCVDAVSLLLTSWLVPGIDFPTPAFSGKLAAAVGAALVLGLVNFLIRPVILLLSIPFGFIVVFVVGFLVNAVTLLIVSWVMPTFQVDGLLVAFLGGIVFGAINAVLTNLLTVNDNDSVYSSMVERLARSQPFAATPDGKRGLVMLEIDGLSYWHMQKAINDGWMPVLRNLQRKRGYVLSRADCGLPSQTSACQSGIMFGDNHDIPAFRWYDKDEQKLFVSGHDAALINARYAKGNGLMRGGSSINNMMNGDAQKSLLTLADLISGTEAEKQDRARDVYLLMLNPYFLMRVLVLFFVDVLRELWQAWRQHQTNVVPRLNRTKHGYPFVRAATTVLMREVSTNLVILDILRGSPSIYMTWPGYDEVAHHSGPWTTDAFKTLKQFDEAIGRACATIDHKAPRQYDLIILSDHGQSFGATFLQRYGIDLKTFIEQHLPEGTNVATVSGGDDGTLSVAALANELANIHEQKVGNRVGRAIARRGHKLAKRGTERQNQDAAAASAATVIVCGSGNLAQVYFDFLPRKITYEELSAAHPTVLDALVKHPGVGFVVGHADDGTAVVFGKDGARNLHSGVVVGVDPLLSYAREGIATVDLRADQLRRIADFPHSGDLIVNSALFSDGTVAAMEELIGSHGGLGGEQTDAFLFHPADVEIGPTRNATDFFTILNNWRNQPAPPFARLPVPKSAGINGWTPANLQRGLGAVSCGVHARRAASHLTHAPISKLHTIP